jgi:hypothetical protein
MNVNAMLPMNLPRAFDWLRPIETLELIYKRAATEAEQAAEAVRIAAARYQDDRSAEATDAYRRADLRYDAARNAFQVASCELMTARRNAARDAQERLNQAATVRLV